MKTAMQEMILWINNQRSICVKMGNRIESDKLNGHISVAHGLLEEEKKQIIQAATCGYFEAQEGQHDPDCYGIEYYAETYSPIPINKEA